MVDMQMRPVRAHEDASATKASNPVIDLYVQKIKDLERQVSDVRAKNVALEYRNQDLIAELAFVRANARPFLVRLREANIERNKLWDPEWKIPIEFRALELAGEVGELANQIKKIARERYGLPGSRVDQKNLVEEVGDVLICLDLLCMGLCIDIEHSVTEKFNLTSEARGFPVRL